MRNSRIAVSLVAFGAALLGPVSGAASPPDAWAEFRENTKTRCLQALKAQIGEANARNYSIKVSAYGSQSFGMAYMTPGTGKASPVYVCVMDKRTLKAEVADVA